MASHIVEVCKIDRIEAHPRADSLMLAHIKGWQFVIRKMTDGRPEFIPGEHVVYIPINSVLTRSFADQIGITKYLSEKVNSDGERVLVVKQAKLRGEPSFGVVIRPEKTWAIGTEVSEHYGIRKYLPPIKATSGDSMPENPRFPKYTDIENLRHFPNIIDPGEICVMTEKIHGTNCRVGIIDGEEVAGSRELQRKRPEEGKSSLYWFPWSLECVQKMLRDLARFNTQVVLYGEVFGAGIQNLDYGCKAKPGFRAFDLLLNGRFQSWDSFCSITQDYGVPTVPTVGFWDSAMDHAKRAASGKSLLGDHIREGVVIKPVYERSDPKVGRVIFKYISDEYLLSKGISDSHDQ